MKRIIAVILTALVLTSIVPIAAYASFGSGVATIAGETKLIKSGLYGRKLTFSDADFKQGLCIEDFEAIVITRLPKSSEGVLMYAGRRVGEGTRIKRKNLPSLVFIPSSKDVTESSFAFTIDGYSDGAELEFILKFTDKVNYEPSVSGAVASSLSISTQREIGVHGKLYAEDGEGDEIEFMIVSYPENGRFTSFDKTNGEYVYTPYDSYTGGDSFVYVARDEWGNFSTTVKVNISVTDRMCEVTYADMKDRAEYNAAVAVTAMGIMNGKIIGDGTYFSPEDTVTRAEFVAMAMKAVGMKQNTKLTSTYFDDNDEIPAPLVSYVATAQRKGIINGTFKDGELIFAPNETITKYEAAVILSRLTGDTDYEGSGINMSLDIPVWARDSVSVMCSVGVFEDGEGALGTESVTRADTARYLYRLMKSV